MPGSGEREKWSVSCYQPWPLEADASVLLLNGAQSICLLMSPDLRRSDSDMEALERHRKCSHLGQPH